MATPHILFAFVGAFQDAINTIPLRLQQYFTSTPTNETVEEPNGTIKFIATRCYPTEIPVITSTAARTQAPPIEVDACKALLICLLILYFLVGTSLLNVHRFSYRLKNALTRDSRDHTTELENGLSLARACARKAWRKRNVLENDNTSLLKHKETLQNTITGLKGEKATLQEQKSTLEKDAKNHQTQTDSLDDAISDLKKEKQAAISQASTLRTANETLQQKLNESEANLVTCRQSHATIFAENERLKESVANYQTQLEKSKRTRDQTSSQLSKREKDLEAANEDKKNATNFAKTLEGELSSLRKQKARDDATAQRKLNDLQNENSEIKSKVASMEGTISELNSKNEEQGWSIKSLNCDLANAKETISGLLSEKDALAGECNHLAGDLKASNTEISELRLQMKAQCEDEKAENSPVESENESLKNRVSELESQGEDLTRRLGEEEAENARVVTENQSLRDSAQFAFDQVQQEMEITRQLRGLRDDLECQIADLESLLSRACWCKRVDGAANGHHDSDENESDGQGPGNNGDHDGGKDDGTSPPDCESDKQQDGPAWKDQNTSAGDSAGDSEYDHLSSDTKPSGELDDPQTDDLSSHPSKQHGNRGDPDQAPPAGVTAGEPESGEPPVNAKLTNEGDDGNSALPNATPTDQGDGNVQPGRIPPAGVTAGASTTATQPSIFDPCPLGLNHFGCTVICINPPDWSTRNSNQQRHYQRKFKERRRKLGCAYAAYPECNSGLPAPPETSTGRVDLSSAEQDFSDGQSITVKLPGS